MVATGAYPPRARAAASAVPLRWRRPHADFASWSAMRATRPPRTRGWRGSKARKARAARGKATVAWGDDMLRLFEAADKFGTLGALVNNAGIVGKSTRVDEMSAERIERMMAV